MLNRIIKQIKQANAYKAEVENDKTNWQSVFHNVNVKDAQSWNPETNKRYRNGHSGSSALVKDIKYDDKNNQLIVTYRDGFTAIYDGINADMVGEFISSDSKGRWALNNLWGRAYH